MLGAIQRVTITANDLQAVESAYTEYLEYRVSKRTRVSDAEAAAWGAPAAAGAKSLSLQPAAAADFEFRFIEGPEYPDYVPLTTFGWNASEIIVENVDALAPRFEDSPFEIVGEPRDLSFSEDIRAMQLRGPANEIIYLTEFKNPVPGLSVPTPRSAVDRTFIVILGGQSMDELQGFYNARFGVPEAPVVESRVTMLSKALGVDVETKYPIAAMALAGKSLIEADEMPPQVGPREQLEGHLPPGIAMVGFGCDRIPDEAIRLGKRLHVMKGVTGELIELL